MGTEKWPIQPDFVSLAENKTEESANFNTDGVYYPDYIRGFLADISYDTRFENALSFFQVVPNDFIQLDERINTDDDSNHKTIQFNEPLDGRIKKIIRDEKIIRIESGIYTKNGCGCERFRKCSQNAIDFCFRQGSRVGIFSNKCMEQFVPHSKDYQMQLESIFNDFNTGEENEYSRLKLKEFKNRIYVHYTCRISFLEEIMFPIYAKGKFVACLLLGVNIENYNKNKSFENTQDVTNLTREDLNEIKKHLPDKNLTKEEWEDKLDVLVRRINIFEKRLEDKINHRSEVYINNEFKKIKEQLNDQTRNIKIKDNNTTERFYNALTHALKSIHNVFDVNNRSFIRIFALPMDNGSKIYVPIGWGECEEEKTNYWEKQKEFYFKVESLKLYTEEHDVSRLTSEQMQEIVARAASKQIEKQFEEEDIIKIIQLAGDSISFIVWKRYKNPKIKEDKKAFNSYKEALLAFYTEAFQSYSYIRGTKMEYMLETIMNATAHESSHFILPALNIVEKKMEIMPKEIIIPAYIQEYIQLDRSYIHYQENVIELLNQLSEINTRPTLIFKDVNPEKEPVQVFPLLYKMTKMMSGIALDSHKKIIYSQKDNYVEVNLDPVYFNHAIFNLIDNAIKYGYEGSYIYIHMFKTSEELIIEITSYGREIEKGRRIYELFERGIDYKETKGLGIGMFIVDKICKAHGATVTHTSGLISNLNLPVLNCYLTNGEYLLRKLDDAEKEKVYQEEKNVAQSVINTVVYDCRYVKNAHVFSTRIFNATYQNTFTITLPI